MLRSFAAALQDCTTCMARAVELTDLNSTSRVEARVFFNRATRHKATYIWLNHGS